MEVELEITELKENNKKRVRYIFRCSELVVNKVGHVHIIRYIITNFK